MIKNIGIAEVLSLKDEVVYQKGQVVSKTITKSAGVNISLFAFDQTEGLSAHTSSGDAFVTILDGEAKITIDQQDYNVKAGESIVMPKNILHALYAEVPFKMLLVIVFGPK